MGIRGPIEILESSVDWNMFEMGVTRIKDHAEAPGKMVIIGERDPKTKALKIKDHVPRITGLKEKLAA